MTPLSWALDFLGRLAVPVNEENVAAILAWEQAEGGHWQNAATFNPLNTTRRGHGGVPIPRNAAGVKAYPTYEDGMLATLETIRRPYYLTIMAKLQAGSDAWAVVREVANSVWGTGTGVIRTLAYGRAEAAKWKGATRVTTYPFVRASQFRSGGNKPISRIVIHRMEAPEKGDTAESVAQYFAGGSGGRTSAHYCIDNNSIVQCVKDDDTAYHAPPNQHSIGLEHAGYSADSDWSDPFDAAMLELSAQLCAVKCRENDIPVVWLSSADLLAGKRGITSHNNVSGAWHKTSHTDPGPGFPVQRYLDLVNKHLHGSTPQEDEVTDADIAKIRAIVKEEVKAAIDGSPHSWAADSATRENNILNAIAKVEAKIDALPKT